jgi:predicted dinucleotide-binding enzyme
MRIAAMAAGAVGGYFAARLAAAGHDVFFIARGAHREAIAKHGLTVESLLGDLRLPKPNVTDDPAKVGPVDIVLFAVKLCGIPRKPPNRLVRWSARIPVSSHCRTASIASSAAFARSA